MKKAILKALSVMLAVVLTLTAAPLSGLVGLQLPEWLDFSIISSAATSGTCGENVTWTFNDSTGTLTISGTGVMYDYNYNNRPWESYGYSIKTVVINNGVTKIGNYAFSYCSNLTSVTIPDSVTTIGNYAFYWCTSLTSVTIPDSVITIGEWAFWYCKSLTSVTIGDSVTTIGDYAFAYCTNLTSVTIPDSVTTIGDRAFYGCPISTIPSAEDKITISNDIYTCLVGESFYISGDIQAAEKVGSVSLTWTSSDGVELNLPASVINSSDTHASFSVQAKGVKAGIYTVRVTGNNNRSDSCQVKVIEPKSDLVVSVEKTNDTGYYYIGNTLFDFNLNELDSVSFKITVKNKLNDECAGMSIPDEVKDKLTIKNISIEAALDNYSALSVDIADITDLKNIGSLALGEEQTFVIDIYPNKLEGEEITANLNLTATADDKDSISESMPILIKDKLYNPYIIVSFMVDKEVIYKDKKYDSESVPVTIKITNKIPSSYKGDVSLLKVSPKYNVEINSAKITADNAELFKTTTVNASITDKTLKAGETITLNGYINIKTNHKIPDDVQYEYANISYEVTSSANTCTGSQEIVFENQDFDYKKNWRVQSLEELIKQMEELLTQCHILTPAEKVLVATTLDAIQMNSNLDDMSKQLDGLECIYDLSCYATGLKSATVKNTGKLLIEKIKSECTNASDALKNEVEDVLQTLVDSEAFNKFAYWYYNQQKVNDGNAKQANVKCPVDVTVTDEGGNIVLSIVNDEVVISIGEVAGFVCEGEKTIYLPTDKNYSIKIIATDNGTMDYSVIERSSDGELRIVDYFDIVLSKNDIFDGDITNETLPETDEYNLTKNNDEEITHDSISTDEHLHSYLLESTKAPTCTQPGVKTFICTLCNKTRTEEVNITGHNHKTVVTAPTCTEDGYTTYSCDCGDTYVADYVDALGHNYVNGTCTVCGTKDPTVPEEPEYNYTFSIQNPSRYEIRNKDGIILHGVVNGTAPNGSYVRWESSNGNFDKSADGSNLKIIAKNKGYTTFTAILCDADGNELARDSVEMYSKSGFFDKIGGFFRSLFGTTKIYEY